MNKFDSIYNIRISFILATKNRGSYLEENLHKLLELKSSNDEFILIDGGSTDNSHEIINKFKKEIDTLIIESDNSAGVAHNKGLLLAKGKYIKILTDDDIFYKEGIEKAHKIMEEDNNIDILLCGGTVIFEGKNEKRHIYLPEGVNYGKSPKDIFRYTGSGSGIFERRSALAKIGLRDTKSFCTDSEILARAIYLKAKVKFCRINMYEHVIYDHSFTSANKGNWERSMLKACKDYTNNFFYFRYFINLKIMGIIGKNKIISLFFKKTKQLIKIILFQNKKYTIKTTRLNEDSSIIEWDGGIS